MPGYFDSSVLLSLLLRDAHLAKARDWWGKESERVSSTLFELECLNVIRRIGKNPTLPKGWLSAKEKRLPTYLEEISLRNLDETVIDIIRKETKLSDCRTLDVIHLATALLFLGAAQGTFIFYTLDARMRGAAAGLGFVVAE